ncbi:MAG TPA: M23 family metallopeptidase [Pyrinomonadaceae bacterium]|nr:M23 family metallopeptidase [Pyrinomonadaceae bacterium]
MRKLFIFGFAAVLLVLALHSQRATSSGDAPPPSSDVVGRLGASFAMARLYAQAPDEKLVVPVRGVRVRQIKDTWHAPRSGERLHQGQDIFAPRGTPVQSATEGYVVRVGENNLGGKTVSVLGAGGRIYYYAHLDDYAPGLSTGDYVTTETVLGEVGTTGNAQGTPPHLHFGVYAAGGAINPLPLLADKS